MPDRFLQAEPLATMIETERVTGSGAVPTIWNDLLRYLDEHPDIDISSLRSVIVGGSACPPALMRAFQERHGITVLHAWGMTEMSPLGTMAVAAGRDHGRGALGATARPRAGSPPACRPAWSGRTAPSSRGTASSVGELEVRGPWITGSYYDGSARGRGPTRSQVRRRLAAHR